MSVAERQVPYELLASSGGLVLLRAGGFYAFGRPEDFRVPWEIPQEQCGTLEELSKKLEYYAASYPGSLSTEKQFLKVLQEVKRYAE